MKWGFRNRIKIAPGIKINLGKSLFSSVTIGGNGASLNLFGKNGAKVTAGLPGTGLNVQQSLGAKRGKDTSNTPQNPTDKRDAPAVPQANYTNYAAQNVQNEYADAYLRAAVPTAPTKLGWLFYRPQGVAGWVWWLFKAYITSVFVYALVYGLFFN